ncbi:MAG: lipase family protein [Lachnospiraceae bacterium]|nr:lipase family protein [Lachnospiraceae bacterium]
MRSSMKKRLCGILSVMLIFTLLSPLHAHAGEGTEQWMKVNFRDGAFAQTYQTTVGYTDSFFADKPTQDGSLNKSQKELAHTSMVASAAMYKKRYAIQLMKKFGFKYLYHYVRTTKTDNDHITYCIGYKRIRDFNLIAIWIKGSGVNYEWVSNFNIGKGKNHKGFSLAEKELDDQVTTFLQQKGIVSNLKFWITGHSRGAAVANLFAKRMTEKYTKSRVFAYTFASPRVSTEGKRKGYENIINILNPGDFVTEVAPKAWGYLRYGIDINLPVSKQPAMEKAFKKLTGKAYEGYSKKGKEALVYAFVQYGGDTVEDYYTRPYMIGYGYAASPATFFQKGLGYFLAGDYREGLKTALGIAMLNIRAQWVLGKLFSDGMISDRFQHAHCQSSYVCWMEASGYGF